MGLVDRSYAREDAWRDRSFAAWSMTAQIIAVTVGVYVLQILTTRRLAPGLETSTVEEWLALKGQWYRQPWQAYQLLSYGFLHSLADVKHILFNMLGLWFFGREIEDRYGRREFLAFYLLAVVVAGAFWSASEASFGARASLIGASGGISAVFVLFALLYPHRQVLFMFFLPMPMWAVALLGVTYDVNGALHRSGNVAFVAHLAGAVFALYYFKMNWRISSWALWPKLSSWGGRKRGPTLRLHDPEPSETDGDDRLSQQVDAILQKIQEQGQDSLSSSERRTLERASRVFQQKRR